jgi:hypothetical protein
METPPDRVPEAERGRVDEEAEAAAAEAAAIGGRIDAGDDSDPAWRAVEEGGGGYAEGFELAEEDLIESAEHGEGGHDRGRPEPETALSGAAYGDADAVEPTDQDPPLEGAESDATTDSSER